ncbi:hypothetical protein A33M_3346 [Rhodovulum sp. PH10]|uniref:DUF2312 domain-containing protein n=1 Tax=Rhodovulum sp. PH10 TaxID=1187851 RepID=UPI00027C2938|nr:DUF2312 domain-containing protein [Rhodovulum sp. PH10]EJW11268.1 hypothetical protein A33M_3346 [Rhodovulum sp. PH10]
MARRKADVDRSTSDQLHGFVERIERLTEEKKALGEDIRDVYLEAKAAGFDTKALREIIKRRTWDRDVLAEHDAIVETYMHALGMLADTPLGRSAIERATMQ